MQSNDSFVRHVNSPKYREVQRSAEKYRAGHRSTTPDVGKVRPIFVQNEILSTVFFLYGRMPPVGDRGCGKKPYTCLQDFELFAPTVF